MIVRFTPVVSSILSLMILSPIAKAECQLQEVVGYTLVGIKTITGRIDKEGRHDDYQGCDYDRILVFDDNTGVRCTGYTYTYSYRPTAYIWLDGSLIKICVYISYLSVGPLR
jgi:hypothetical protein